MSLTNYCITTFGLNACKHETGHLYPTNFNFRNLCYRLFATEARENVKIGNRYSQVYGRRSCSPLPTVLFYNTKHHASTPHFTTTNLKTRSMIAANEAHRNDIVDNPFLHTVSVPALHPKRMWPTCYSEPLMFLQKLDHIDIIETKTMGGVVFYVLDVYIRYQVDCIPTNNKHEHLEYPQIQEQREPDFRVLRRFSDFETVRKRVTAASQQQLMATCPYCNSIRVFMFACYRRPTGVIKLCTGPEIRKQLLTQFINRLIEYTLGHPKSDMNTRPQDVWCLEFQSIPVIVEQFIQLRCYHA